MLLFIRPRRRERKRLEKRGKINELVLDISMISLAKDGVRRAIWLVR